MDEHTFYIRNKDQQVILYHVDLDYYSHVKLMFDVYDYVLKDIPSNISYVFSTRCMIPYLNQWLELRNDNDIMEMFMMHSGVNGLYLEIVDVNVVKALSQEAP